MTAALASPALAADASARSFDQAYFSAFNPVSAEDMVRRIPGFTLDNGDDRRGFGGAAGNVLINGQRTSSKVLLSDQLARIAAGDVLRIDLYAGGQDGADLRGQTLLVDVRLRPRESGATNTYMAQVGVMDPGGKLNPVLSVTSAFKLVGGAVSLSFQAQPHRMGRVEYQKRLTSPSLVLLEQAQEFVQGDYWEYKLSGRANWKPNARDSFNLNAQIIPSRDGRTTGSETHNGAGGLLHTDASQVTGDLVWASEIGGDWEHRLSPSTSFKLIGLASRKATGSDEHYTTRTPVPSRRDTYINRSTASGEYIGRGVMTWRSSPTHSLDFGGEGAFNYRDSHLNIAVDSGAGRVTSNIPVANTRVEELRAEAYVTDFWQWSPSLKLESSLNVETSRISQSGDATQERQFTYFKPRLNLNRSAANGDQWRFLLDRDVAQLDFAEFASAVSLFDGTVELGNPNLEPERTWRAQVEWERSFGPKSAIVLAAFYHDIDAVQDQIPIAGQDGPGNIGRGHRAGVKGDLSAPLDRFGIPGGELRLTGLMQQTRATDPTTHLSRRLSGETEWNYSISFRQTLPKVKMVWGALYERADSIPQYKLKELLTNNWDRPSLDLYVETTKIKGATVRFTITDVLRPVDVRERMFYAPNRSSPANLTSIETRPGIGGYGTRSYTIRVAGRF